MATKGISAATAAKDITPEQVAAWKKKYGKVFRYEAEDGKTCYLRRPTRQIVSLASVQAGVDRLMQMEIMLRNCWLGGDSELQSEDRYFYGVAALLDNMIEVVSGEIKEA